MSINAILKQNLWVCCGLCISEANTSSADVAFICELDEQ